MRELGFLSLLINYDNFADFTLGLSELVLSTLFQYDDSAVISYGISALYALSV